MILNENIKISSDFVYWIYYVLSVLSELWVGYVKYYNSKILTLFYQNLHSRRKEELMIIKAFTVRVRDDSQQQCQSFVELYVFCNYGDPAIDDQTFSANFQVFSENTTPVTAITWHLVRGEDIFDSEVLGNGGEKHVLRTNETVSVIRRAIKNKLTTTVPENSSFRDNRFITDLRVRLAVWMCYLNSRERLLFERAVLCNSAL